MQEKCEFRVDEDFADLLFRADEGKRLGTMVRKVELSTSDPRYPQMGILQEKLNKEKNKSFFHGWWFKRTYSKQEMQNALCFYMHISSAFEPAGEECGTDYDLSHACPRCGSGRIQKSALVLSVSKIPKGKDISRTIGEEIVVSKRLADAMRKSKLTGFDLRPVLHGKKKTPTADWFQLVLDSPAVNVVAPTQFGIAPFDNDEKGQYRCSEKGHSAGLNLLSQVYVERGKWASNDMNGSRQLVGWRMGLLVPHPLLFISHRLFDIFQRLKVKGCEIQAVPIS